MLRDDVDPLVHSRGKREAAAILLAAGLVGGSAHDQDEWYEVFRRALQPTDGPLGSLRVPLARWRLHRAIAATDGVQPTGQWWRAPTPARRYGPQD